MWQPLYYMCLYTSFRCEALNVCHTEVVRYFLPIVVIGALFSASVASAALVHAASATPILVRTLQRGASGEDVAFLQRFLNDQGYLAAAPTSYYGPVTAQAVAALQASNGLEQTGVVGPKTRALLTTLTSSTSSSSSTRTPAAIPSTKNGTVGQFASQNGTVTQAELAAAVQQVLDSVHSQLYGSNSSTVAGGGVWGAIAASQHIDAISNVTVNGTVTGLTAASIPTNIVASNYLPLTGGSLTGMLGVGTTSPWAQLSVVPSSTGPSFVIGSSTATSFIVTNTGMVGVGTANPTTMFDVFAPSQINNGPVDVVTVDVGTPLYGQYQGYGPSILFKDSPANYSLNMARIAAVFESQYSNNYGALSFSTNANANLTTFPTEKMRISAFGNVGIGTTTPYARLSVQANPTDASINKMLFAIGSSTVSATTTLFSVDNTGIVTINGTVGTCVLGNGNSATNCSSSDERLKTNITPLAASSSLVSIDALNAVSFNWNDWMVSNGSATSTQFGFIAQEIQKVFPNLVHQDSRTGYYTLDYQGLFAPIVGAIQTLSSRLSSLETTVAGFANSFTSKQVNTNTLCVKKADGSPVCVTGDQLSALLATAGQSSVSPAIPSTPIIASSSASGGDSMPSDTVGTTTSTSTPVAPVVGAASSTTDTASITAQ